MTWPAMKPEPPVTRTRCAVMIGLPSLSRSMPGWTIVDPAPPSSQLRHPGSGRARHDPRRPAVARWSTNRTARPFLRPAGSSSPRAGRRTRTGVRRVPGCGARRSRCWPGSAPTTTCADRAATATRRPRSWIDRRCPAARRRHGVPAGPRRRPPRRRGAPVRRAVPIGIAKLVARLPLPGLRRGQYLDVLAANAAGDRAVTPADRRRQPASGRVPRPARLPRAATSLPDAAWHSRSKARSSCSKHRAPLQCRGG